MLDSPNEIFTYLQIIIDKLNQEIYRTALVLTYLLREVK